MFKLPKVKFPSKESYQYKQNVKLNKAKRKISQDIRKAQTNGVTMDEKQLNKFIDKQLGTGLGKVLTKELVKDQKLKKKKWYQK